MNVFNMENGSCNLYSFKMLAAGLKFGILYITVNYEAFFRIEKNNSQTNRNILFNQQDN